MIASTEWRTGSTPDREDDMFRKREQRKRGTTQPLLRFSSRSERALNKQEEIDCELKVRPRSGADEAVKRNVSVKAGTSEGL